MKPWLKWLIIIIVGLMVLSFVFWIIAAMKMKNMYDQNAGNMGTNIDTNL